MPHPKNPIPSYHLHKQSGRVIVTTQAATTFRARSDLGCPVYDRIGEAIHLGRTPFSRPL